MSAASGTGAFQTPVEHVVVVGATGDVGRGVVAHATAAGHLVTIVGRRAEALAALVAEYPAAGMQMRIADVSTLEGARSLVGGLDLTRPVALVIAVSVPWQPVDVLDLDTGAAATYWQQYLGAHLSVIQAALPVLAPGSVVLAIGGGMADFVAPGMAAVSMSQAAQRMLYRTLHAETKDRGVLIRELMVVSKVHGKSNSDQEDRGLLTDSDIGIRALDILAFPEAEHNIGPIIKILPAR